jgi:hypothetical protein
MKLLSILARCLKVLTSHYPLHKPEHVGQFASSLVALGDWQHR